MSLEVHMTRATLVPRARWSHHPMPLATAAGVEVLRRGGNASMRRSRPTPFCALSTRRVASRWWMRFGSFTNRKQDRFFVQRERPRRRRAERRAVTRTRDAAIAPARSTVGDRPWCRAFVGRRGHAHGTVTLTSCSLRRRRSHGTGSRTDVNATTSRSTRRCCAKIPMRRDFPRRGVPQRARLAQRSPRPELRAIRQRGPPAFYTGPIADAIVATYAEGGIR